MAKTTTVLGIVTTAAVGAALMYLFDPEKGAQRREKIGGVASDALSSAGSYAGDTWETVSDKVKDIASDLQDRASGFAADHDGALKDQVSKLASYATVLGAKLAGGASGWRDGANTLRDRAGGLVEEVRERGNGYFDRERHGVGTIAAIGAGGVGMFVLGAGLVYFLDPDHGEQRRASAINCANRAVGDIGEFAGKAGQYLRDHIPMMGHGPAAEAETEAVHRE